MTPELVLQHLEELLAKLGVVVRTDSFDPRLFGDHCQRGGICRVNSRTVVVVDARAQITERVAVLAAAAATLDTELVYVPPLVRQIIDAHSTNASRDMKKPALRLVHPSRPRKDCRKPG